MKPLLQTQTDVLIEATVVISQADYGMQDNSKLLELITCKKLALQTQFDPDTELFSGQHKKVEPITNGMPGQ